ncbi:unnamed protein product [Choristocarpus tenellus]
MLSADCIDIWKRFIANLTIAGIASMLVPIALGTTWTAAFAFLARGPALIALISSWIITPEFFPTEVRSTCHATCTGFERIGAICASFLINSNGLSTVGMGSLLLVSGLIGIAAVWALPETRNMDLDQSIISLPEKLDSIEIEQVSSESGLMVSGENEKGEVVSSGFAPASPSSTTVAVM